MAPLRILRWFVVSGKRPEPTPKHENRSHWSSFRSASQSVERSQCLQEPSKPAPFARIWRVYRRLSLRHINTQAHANSDTHSLCVSLSSQIRKHDIIVLSCVSVRTHTGRNAFHSECARIHVSTRSVCGQNANVISVLMTFSSLLMSNVFMNTELISLDV